MFVEIIRINLRLSLSYTLLVPEGESASPWLAGINLDAFNGPTLGEKIAEAAYSINANILSPVADPDQPGYSSFITKSMLIRAHELGLAVKPWTV